MARSPLSLKQMLLLTTLLIISFFSATTMAADSESTTATSANAKSTTTTAAAATSTAATTTATGATTAKITATGTDTESAGTLPAITTSTTSAATTNTNKLNLPTLSTADTAVPTYPAPTVPPTTNAPFMQHSSVPDGTVFIAVGSILGGLAVAIILWRAIVAYLLHRSIARASLAQTVATDKGPLMPVANASFYKYADRESSLNLAGAAAGSAASGRGVRRTNRGPTPSATPSMSNLFFSPTAPGANAVGAAANNNNRDSRLLPSGFYAAGQAAPAAGHGQAIGLSNLRPDGRTNSRHMGGMGSTPPDSPSFSPARSTPAPRTDLSTSTVNLNLIPPTTGRTPSAYLDDLLDEQPHLFPPGAPGAPSAPGGGAAHQRNVSQSSQSSRRY